MSAPPASRTAPPRLLAVALAAAYCGITVRQFRRNVPVAPVRIGSVELWDLRALDTYIDSLQGIRGAEMKVDWASRVAAF
jgi:hypothetical protein